MLSASGPLVGTVRPPSNTSLPPRAYILEAMAEPGVPSTILRPLAGEDCDATLAALVECGHDIERFEAGENGEEPMTLVQPGPWQSPTIPLDCGNSGTTMRLLCGVLASRSGLSATLIGDPSLSRRPMGRVVVPLRSMGAEISGETAPLQIEGQRLQGVDYESPVASAQVKSSLLLAGLNASGTTWIKEPAQSRDHTERMLDALGVTLMKDDDGRIGVMGGQTWGPMLFRVPGDVSSAAFLMVAAALVPGSQVRLIDVGVNPTRTGILDVLEAAGAAVSLDIPREETGEPVADVTVRGDCPLSAFEVGGPLVPRLIDEIPVLAVLATQCQGRTCFRDAKELRVKESDRITVMAHGLASMGAYVEELEDGLAISGPTPLKGTAIDATGDHRVAMAFAVASLIAEGVTTITGTESVRTSYPDFLADLMSLAGSTG